MTMRFWKGLVLLSIACIMTPRIAGARIKRSGSSILKESQKDVTVSTEGQSMKSVIHDAEHSAGDKPFMDGVREKARRFGNWVTSIPSMLKGGNKEAEVEVATYSVEKEDFVSTLVWNVGGPQTSPFEFRSSDNDANALIDAVENDERKVGEVFTSGMMEELAGKMRAAEIPEDQIALVQKHWEALSPRHVVDGYLMDKSLDLGNRRSVAAADMFTGTIQTATGPAAMRPAVINCGAAYDTPEEWWSKWLEFMFDSPVKPKKATAETKVWKLLKPIAMKYFKDLHFGSPETSDPAGKWTVVSAPDEKFEAQFKGVAVISADPGTDTVRAQFLADQFASVPLQLLHLAIFDAITVTSMMEAPNLAKDRKLVRAQLCEAIQNKDSLTLSIIGNYAKTLKPDVIFLTEVGFGLQQSLISGMSDEYWYAKHPDASTATSKKKEFNLILFRKDKFQGATGAPEAGGFDVAELLMVPVKGLGGEDYLFAAFHGQSSGSTSIRATNVILERAGENAKVIAGMDANVINAEALEIEQFASYTTFDDYNSNLESKGLGTSSAALSDMNTCKKVRTIVNTQLQKAVRLADASSSMDKNPKDHTIFKKDQLEVVNAIKINSPSDGTYDDDLVFPTANFPSDHGLLFTKFRVV